jgi:uncharacterized RmlC-like cupin family protein
MATLVRGKDLKYSDRDGKSPGHLQFGITEEKVGENPKIILGHGDLPPGYKSRRHYHPNFAVALFNYSGHRRLIVGPDHEKQEVDLGPGDFLFVPQGEIHNVVNLSDTEGTDVVFCYIGIGSMKEVKTVFLEPPLK